MVQLRTYGKRRNTERSINFGILFCRRADRRHQSQKVNLPRLHLGIQRNRKLSLNIVGTLHLPPSFSFWSQESIRTLDSSLTPISAPLLGSGGRGKTIPPQKRGSIMCARELAYVVQYATRENCLLPRNASLHDHAPCCTTLGFRRQRTHPHFPEPPRGARGKWTS